MLLEQKLDKSLTDYDWLYKFLDRNPDFSIWKNEDIFLSRANDFTKEDTYAYLNILKSVFEKKIVMDKPDSIYNVDETRLSLNNKAGYVLGEKWSIILHLKRNRRILKLLYAAMLTSPSHVSSKALKNRLFDKINSNLGST